MSKRWGNVINPDDVIENVGADALRVYEMFMGPFGQAIAWSTDHMVGARRFLEKVFGLQDAVKEGGSRNELVLHKTIQKVATDIENFAFNTAISQLMIHVNDMEGRESIDKDEFLTFLRLLAPFAPHITEELWYTFGADGSVHTAKWPEHDEQILAQASVTIAVQVNGKTRGTFEATPDMDEKALTDAAKNAEGVYAHLEGKEIKREIVVPGRLVSFVVS